MVVGLGDPGAPKSQVANLMNDTSLPNSVRFDAYLTLSKLVVYFFKHPRTLLHTDDQNVSTHVCMMDYIRNWLMAGARLEGGLPQFPGPRL